MLFFFQHDVLDEILNLLESVSEGFLPSLTKISDYIDSCIFAKLLDSFKPYHFFDQQAGTSLKLLVILNVMPEQTDTLSIF